MDSDKGPVVFPLLTLGEVFHVKNSLCFFFVIISLADIWVDSDKGPVVFPLLTLGEVFHVKNSLCFFL